jgi:uncharacterized protein (DUF983 family)
MHHNISKKSLKHEISHPLYFCLAYILTFVGLEYLISPNTPLWLHVLIVIIYSIILLMVFKAIHFILNGIRKISK